jgi:integrase
MVEKPEPQDRDVVVSPEEYEKVLTLVRGGFRDLLVMAWESGIRPQEIRVVEAKHLDFTHGRIVFPVKEFKGKKLPRVVYLPDEAFALARKLAAAYETGPIFRNADGVPWTRYAINCAFIRLQKKLGRKLHLGAFRKSFATEALKNGVDVVTTSHLLGHTNPAMLAKVYARMQHDPEYLRGQAKKATGGD